MKTFIKNFLKRYLAENVCKGFLIVYDKMNKKFSPILIKKDSSVTQNSGKINLAVKIKL